MKTIDVVTGVLIQGSRILVTRRKQDAHLAGFWEFPGGKREADESESDALARELSEELGVKARIGECLHRETFSYPERIVNLAFYRCELKPGSPDPRPLASAAMKWIAINQLRDKDFPPANARVLALLRSSG
ncbi:MAG: (deoxy)nucleoside triphosphate pyrophosphohydrolase [Acidobacteriota bacterium]|nr:(deoxy)nucleoside triphosphate pyrophosphohydrolase [Acidobacteriota bacterium]